MYRKVVLTVALAATLAMGAYPPWQLTRWAVGTPIMHQSNYGWISSPPQARPTEYWHCEIDLKRLLVQWALVWLVALAALVLRGRTSP